MGLAGEIVKSVFSKNRTPGAHDNNSKNYGMDRRRWSLVRSYLCGDEFNSIIAENESASIRSSEPTVTQPLMISPKSEENSPENVTGEYDEGAREKEENPPSKLSMEENAAIVIQSAFRGFLARHRYREIEQLGTKKLEILSPESVDSSVEAQVGDSVENLSVSEQSFSVSRRVQQKHRSYTSKIKEDWDDSTVSTNVLKLRIRNKLEATTRRERALAYAFSQQLRTCTPKKKTREANMGWNWLERWMATRLPENSWAEDNSSNIHEPVSGDQRCIIIKKTTDIGGEEKESCGSNDVSKEKESCDSNDVSNGGDSLKADMKTNKEDVVRVKRGIRVTKSSVSRRRTVPGSRLTTHSARVKCYNHSDSATDLI